MKLNSYSIASWPLVRSVACLGLCLASAAIAAAQFVPPEPPSDQPTRERTDASSSENQFDRDNSAPRVTERSRSDSDNPSNDVRDPPRNDDTRYVPDPRPGGMSEPLSSGNFDVERVRSADIGLWFDRSTADGLVINDIGTGAISRLGFREGDRIYSVNGIRVDSEAAFVRTLFDPRWRSERVAVVIYRHGRPWTVYMQPAVFVQEYATVEYDPLDDWGLVLDDRYDDYVVVWRVRPRSPAFYAGLRAGDVIVNWQGRRLAGREDFVGLVQQGGLRDVALDINRSRQIRRIDLDLSGLNTRTGARTSLRPDFDASRGPASGRPNVVIEGDPAARSSAELEGTLRVDRPVESNTGGRVNRPDNRGMFPNSEPIPRGAQIERGRRGIFGGSRP